MIVEDQLRHIVIVGSSKTGTTGLFYSVRNGLEHSGVPFYSLYEKHGADIYRFLDLYAPDRHVLAKLLVTNKTFKWRVAAEFRRRVLIVRDPRDTLVSALLFFPVLAVNRDANPRKIEQFTDLVRRKEADPQSLSLRELLERAYALNSRMVDRNTAYASRFRKTMAYNNRVDSFVVRYESFVDGDLGDLETYLELELGSGKSDSSYSHIERTSSYGGWRNWLVESDVDYFRPLLHDYMSRYGYADDWELADVPSIRTEEASGYIERSCRIRREQRSMYGDRAETGEERVTFLRGRADAGDSDAALALGRLLLARREEAVRVEAASRLEFAACAGNAEAMQLLARCYRRGLGMPVDEPRACFWQREARLLRRAQELEQEVTRLRARARDGETRSGAPSTAPHAAGQRIDDRRSFPSRVVRKTRRALRRVKKRITAQRNSSDR